MTKVRIRPIQALLPLWKSNERYRVAYGGRGSGKSYGVAQRFVTYALREKCRLLCTRDVQNTLSESALAILKRVITDMEVGPAFVQTKHGLACLTGSEFVFRGLQNPDRIKSLEGIKYCWVEEAQKVTRTAWDVLSPTIREAGSEIWATFNPDQESDPVYADFVLKDHPEASRVQVNYPDNPYFPQPLQLEMAYDRRTDYDKYLHIWMGNPRTISEAQVFYHKYRVDAFETPTDVPLYYGADWGFSQDPTVLVRCFIKNQILWVDQEVYGVGVDIDELPAMFAAVPGAQSWPITADSERPDTISYMQQRGYQMRGAKKGKGSVEDGVQFLRSFRGVVIHPRCKHTADEFRLYSYKTDKLTGDVMPILEDKHNHCIDALRYAVEKIMRSVGSVAKLSAAELGL